MSSTIVGIRDDLEEAEEALKAAQNALIDALDQPSGALPTAEKVAELEAEVARCEKLRNTLRDTKHFVIQRQRNKAAENQEKTFVTAIYLSEFADGLQVDDIVKLVNEANLHNEETGITGCLYIFNGFFAGYLEGDGFYVDRLLRSRLPKDPRHKNFQVAERHVTKLQSGDNSSEAAAAPERQFPKNALAAKWMMEQPTNPSERCLDVILGYLARELHFINFVPKQMVGAVPGSVQDRRPACIIAITPALRFFESVESQPETLAAALKSVHNLLKRLVDENAMMSGAVLSPHNDRVLIAIQNADVTQTIMPFLNQLFKAFREEVPVYTFHLGALMAHASDARIVNDGSVTIVGPALRTLRLLTTVAEQNDVPFALHTSIQEEIDEGFVKNMEDPLPATLVSIGHYDFDRKVKEVFTSGVLQSMTWDDILAEETKRQHRHLLKTATAYGSGSQSRISSTFSPARSEGPPAAQLNDDGTFLPPVRKDPRVPRRPAPEDHITAEEYAKMPHKDALTDEKLERAFTQMQEESVRGDKDAGVLMMSVQEMFLSKDTLGHLDPLSEFQRSLKALGHTVSEVSNGGRLSFDEFGVLWAKAEQW